MFCGYFDIWKLWSSDLAGVRRTLGLYGRCWETKQNRCLTWYHKKATLDPFVYCLYFTASEFFVGLFQYGVDHMFAVLSISLLEFRRSMIKYLLGTILSDHLEISWHSTSYIVALVSWRYKIWCFSWLKDDRSPSWIYVHMNRKTFSIDKLFMLLFSVYSVHKVGL